MWKIWVGLTIAPSAFAAEYYVATTGSDSNPGTIAQPFATLQKAANLVVAGDTVWIRGGTYSVVTPATSGAGITLTKSGTSDTSRIKFWAYPGELPIFDFSKLQISTTGYTSGFAVSGSWLHLKGFEIRNVPMNTRSNTGLGVNDPAHDDIFELLDIHHNNGSGFFISHGTGGHLVLNCDSHDNYDPTSTQGDGQNADGFGAHYQESGKTTTFRGCRAWWNSDDGWDFISQEYPVVVENCWAYGNGRINSGTGRPADGNGNGFKAGSSKTGIRHVVRNNVAWNNVAAGFYANHSSGGNDWYNNTAYNNGTAFNLLASTWDADGNRTDGVTLSGARAHKMRNNIGFPNKNSYVDGYGVDTTFNTWELGIAPAAGDFASVSDTGFMGPRQADGSLPNLDFMKLRAGSKMIDKGTNVGLPYVGAAPDLGAYEYGAVASGGTNSGGGPTASGGGPNTGGTTASGGTTSSGGSGRGGETSGAGATAKGGSSNSGGASTLGGTPGTSGGASGGSASGGRNASGGSVAAGGTSTVSGGTTGVGGASGASGATPLGGAPVSSGGRDSGGAPSAQGGGVARGGAEGSSEDASGCGCRVVVGSDRSSSGRIGGLLLVGLALTARKRRKRRGLES